MADRLSKYFPIEELVESCLVNGLFDVTLGFAVQWPEVYTLSDVDYSNIHQGLVSVISRLPAGCVLHYQGFYFDRVFKGQYNGSSEIQKENFKYYADRPILKNYSNVYLTFQHRANVSTYSDSPIARAWDWFSGKRTGEIEKVVQNYQKYFGPFESDLKSIPKVSARRMTDENLMCSLYDYFNLSYDNPVTEVAQALKGIQDIEINIDQGYMRIGNQFAAVVTLTKEGSFLVSSQDKRNAELPDKDATGVKIPKSISLPTSMPFRIGVGLPFSHIVNVGIEVIDNDEATASLSGIADIGTNILATVGVREAVSKQAEKEEFLSTLANNSYRACRTKVNVIVNDASLVRLQEKLNYIKNAFIRMNDSTVFFENEHAGNLFLSSSPGAFKFLYREPILQTVDQAVCYIPKESQYFSDKEGIVFVDRFGAPVILNMWNSPYIVNRNKVVFGPSGTGKSVLLNHLITQNLANGHHVIIIDIGGSYKKNCNFHEGYYFNSAERKNLSFNVFLCAQDQNGNFRYSEGDEDGEGADDQINYVYSVVRKLWRGNDKVSNDEKNILKDSIVNFYEQTNLTKTFPTLSEYYKFIDQYESSIMKKEYKDFINLNSLRLALEPYVFGEYKYLLNSTQNVLLQHERYIVFDLEGIKNNEDLSGIVMTIVMGIATNKIDKTHGVRKTLIIDEAIDFLKGDAADFIGGSYRKIRKREGEVILATQGVGYLDEIDALTRKSIIGNSDTVMLLSHKNDKNSYPLLKKYFLNEHQISLLESMESGDRYREVFIKMGSFAKVYRTEISYFAEGVYTTTKTELEEIYRLEKELGNLGAAINQFVYNKYYKQREEK